MVGMRIEPPIPTIMFVGGVLPDLVVLVTELVSHSCLFYWLWLPRQMYCHNR